MINHYDWNSIRTYFNTIDMIKHFEEISVHIHDSLSIVIGFVNGIWTRSMNIITE